MRKKVVGDKVQAIDSSWAYVNIGGINHKVPKDKLESLVSDGAFALQEMDHLAKQEAENSLTGIEIEEF